jgi:hypothetical protein
MSVTITCTKKDGTTITAQATGDGPITWSLHISQQGGLGLDVPPTSTSLNNGVYTATWSSVTDGTSYRVTATNGQQRTDSQPVPFGTYT